MSGPAVTIREIARLRRFARDLKEQIDRAPKQLKVQQAKVARQEDLQREGQEAIKKLKVGIHEKEVTLKSTHTLIAKHQKQLNEAGSKKEYDALRAEIDSEKRNCAKLEDQILALMTEMDDLSARLPELEQNVKKARDEHQKFEAGSVERNAVLAQQLKETIAKLKEIEPTLPAVLHTNYYRIVAGMGADAFAAVVDHNCTACYTSMTVQTRTELLMENFVVCKACGRMLYLPE